MNTFVSLWKENKSFAPLFVITAALVALTSIHHIYGGSLYNTSWRIIMPLFFFIPMLALTLWFQVLAATKTNKALLVTYAVLAGAWILIIGFGEGGYNHLLKNILYFGGAPKDLLQSLFPPELGNVKLYEEPNDFLFEASGIASTLFSFGMIATLIPFLKDRWTRHD